MKPNFNLDDLKREKVYRVPEDYFDKLPSRIMQRVTAAPETSKETGWLSAPWRLAFAGTGFAAVFATVFMLNPAETQTGFSGQLAQVGQSEIVNYLLASEQLERADLTMLNATDQDLTHEFLTMNDSEISDELAEAELIDETYL